MKVYNDKSEFKRGIERVLKQWKKTIYLSKYSVKR